MRSQVGIELGVGSAQEHYDPSHVFELESTGSTQDTRCSEELLFRYNKMI